MRIGSKNKISKYIYPFLTIIIELSINLQCFSFCDVKNIVNFRPTNHRKFNRENSKLRKSSVQIEMRRQIVRVFIIFTDIICRQNFFVHAMNSAQIVLQQCSVGYNGSENIQSKNAF